nr:ribonuclease H-like domain-containing protein [Tanacetum cinerariifolium]
MFLSQKKYALDLLDRMANCNPTRTPVGTESKLGFDRDLISDPILYHCLAGGLQYLIFTHPDISYAVKHACLHKHDPLEPHLAAGFPTTKRSTSCYCVFLGDSLLSWSAKWQHTLFRSSAVAEYKGVANVRVLRVLSHYHYADIFTKGLPFALFEEFCTILSVRPSPAQTVREC